MKLNKVHVPHVDIPVALVVAILSICLVSGVIANMLR
jgi:hypothetical protein